MKETSTRSVSRQLPERRGGRSKELRHLKVLLVNKFYFLLGGPESYLFQLETLLKEKGHSVLVFSTRDPRNRESEQSRFFVEKIDYNRPDIPLLHKATFALRLLYSFPAARNMDALLRRERPDIAHLHNICHQLSPSILPVLRRHRIPIVQTLHDLKWACPNYTMLSASGICERCRGGRYYNAILQRCVKGSVAFSALNSLEAYFHRAIRIYDRIDFYLSPSIFFKEKLISFGMDARRITVLPNFVVLPPLSSPCPGGHVFYGGHLARHKGVLTLVRAVQGESALRLVMAGSGPEESAIRRYLRQKQMGNVRLVGFVDDDERARLMREASFVVLPSECYENCPLVILEAFAYGKPVVAARIGGIPELVRPGFNGFLFEPGNAAELREKIRYLMSHPEEIARMGSNAREAAEEAYSPEVHYRNLMRIYRRVIAGHSRRSPRRRKFE